MELVQTEDREATLARYRRLRAVSIELHNEALRRVGTQGLLAHARKLGLVQGGAIVGDFDSEMQMVFDLAIYTAPPGRTTAVQRSWSQNPPPAGSDEARLVEAMARSRFSLWRVGRRHGVCGTLLSDLLDGDEDAPRTWLMDEGLEASLPDGAIFAARLISPEAFAMTTGTIVPFNTDVLLAMNERCWERYAEWVPGGQARLATEIYRAALAVGATEQVAYLEAGEDIAAAKRRLFG